MDKKRIISIVTMVVGLILVVVGGIILGLKLNAAPVTADGEYLVTAGSWKLKDEDEVVWNFTEIGKGTLTTNNHVNDYDFAWALEEDSMKIRTNWLYEFDNEYQYDLDQEAGILVLSDGEKEYQFVAQSE